MNGKVLLYGSVSLAVIVAALSSVVVMNKREAVARARLATAEAEEAAAKDAARQARSEEAAEASKAEAAKASLKAAEENLQAKQVEQETAIRQAAKAESDKAKAIADKARAASEESAAQALREAEKAKAEAAAAEAEKAKQLARAEASKAEAAAAALAKEELVANRVIAEAKLYELKQLDLAALEQELLAYKRDLDERELALRPEKTIEDLVWVSKDDMVIGEDGTVKKQEKTPYLAENDKTIPVASRELARTTRKVAEARADRDARDRSQVVSSLERLYVEALKADRVTDASFYRKTLKTLYPDWEYKPPQKDQEEGKK